MVGWDNSHTCNPPYGGSGTSRGEVEDVVLVVAGPEPCGQSAGQRYHEGAGRWLGHGWGQGVIRKPGSEVVDGERQTATGMGRQKLGNALAVFTVGKRKLRRSLGI